MPPSSCPGRPLPISYNQLSICRTKYTLLTVSTPTGTRTPTTVRNPYTPSITHGIACLRNQTLGIYPGKGILRSNMERHCNYLYSIETNYSRGTNSSFATMGKPPSGSAITLIHSAISNYHTSSKKIVMGGSGCH